MQTLEHMLTAIRLYLEVNGDLLDRWREALTFLRGEHVCGRSRVTERALSFALD